MKIFWFLLKTVFGMLVASVLGYFVPIGLGYALPFIGGILALFMPDSPIPEQLIDFSNGIRNNAIWSKGFEPSEKTLTQNFDIAASQVSGLANLAQKYATWENLIGLGLLLLLVLVLFSVLTVLGWLRDKSFGEHSSEIVGKFAEKGRTITFWATAGLLFGIVSLAINFVTWGMSRSISAIMETLSVLGPIITIVVVLIFLSKKNLLQILIVSLLIVGFVSYVFPAIFGTSSALAAQDVQITIPTTLLTSYISSQVIDWSGDAKILVTLVIISSLSGVVLSFVANNKK